jgi:outer membrane protein assembly factor BamB/tetratricopeptide (TPR) repeat protein
MRIFVSLLAVTVAALVARGAEAAGSAARPPEAVGAALRRLDWWEKTPVSVRKLETYEKSEEELLAQIPPSTFSLDWYILGPIPAKSLSDCYRSYPPEAGVDLSAPVTVGEQKFSWQRPNASDKVGPGLELSDFFKAKQGGVAYLYRELTVPEATDTNFYLGFAGGCRLWLNGKETFASDAPGASETDRVELPVHLEAGTNRLLVKTFTRTSYWAFFFHTGTVNPRWARIKGRWLLADLFPEAPDRQLAARLRVVQELLDLADVTALRAATDLLRELAPSPVDKDFLGVLQRVATTAQDRGEDVEAERAWTLANELLPRAPADLRPSLEPVFLSSLAAARSRLGDLRGAERLYRQLLESYPKAEVTPEALWVLAEYLRREGRTAEARPYYERLLSDFPSDQRVKAAATALVWCEQATGDRSVRKGSFSAAQHLSQAARLESSGNPRNALQLYLDALRQWPEELVRLEPDRLASLASIVQERARTLWPTLPPEAQAELTQAAEQDFAPRPASSVGRPSAEGPPPGGRPGGASSASDDSLGELLREHPLAPSAPEVLAHWAETLLEKGDLGRAGAALVTLLENYRLDRARQAQAEAQLAFAAGLLGDRSLYDLARSRLADEASETAVTWAGGKATIADVRAWLDAHAPRPEAGLPRVDRLPRAPVVARLLPDHRGQELLSTRWPTPRLPIPWRPVLVGDILFSYDQERARAFSLAGKVLWRSEPYPQPLRAVVGRNFAGQPGYLTVLDDRRVYALELAGDSAFRATRTGLFAYDRTTGQVLWSTESEPGLADREVGSPPLLAFDRLYLVAYSRDVLAEEYLVALDPQTGHVVSSTLVASANSSLKVFRDPANTSDYDATSLLPPPAADATHLYVVTQMGSVVAVDALSQALDWVLEYPRTFLTASDDAFFLNYVCRGLSAPLIVGDLLVALPRDSGGLLAIDRKSGALRWQRADYEFSELWGVGTSGAEQLVVASDVSGTVVACAVETGEVRWSWRAGALERAGRGVVGDGRVIVPTAKALYELSLPDGRVQAVHPLGVPCQEVTGLTVSAQGMAAAWEGGLLLWPLTPEGAAETAPSPTGPDETYVPGPVALAAQPQAPDRASLVQAGGAATQAGAGGEPAEAPPTTAAAAAPAEPPQPGQPGSAEAETTAWAPVAPVGGADSTVVLLPRADGPEGVGGGDAVTWDGTWLSYYRLERRPELRWRRALQWTAPRLRANSFLLVVAAGPELLALERESGRELWRWSIPVRAGGYWPFDGDSRSFQELCASESLVVAGITRKVFAFEARTGKELWSFGLENDLRSLTLEEGGVGSAPPAAGADGATAAPVIFLSATHYSGRLFLYALDASDGRPRVEAEFHDVNTGTFSTIAEGHRLWYIEAERKRITAYDLAQGTQLWREAYGDVALGEYLGADEHHLFFVLRPPRGQPPRLLAVEKDAGARAFVLDSPQFQYNLRPQEPSQQESLTIFGLTGEVEHVLSRGGRTRRASVQSVPRSFHTLAGEDAGLEPGSLLLCQQGTDLVAWRAYRNDEACRWPLFAEQEVLTGVARSGRLLFLAVVRPLVPGFIQAKTPGGERPGPATLLMQPTVRVVELPEGKVRGQAVLPPINAGVPLERVVPVEHGLLSEGEAGLIFLAPVGAPAALEELRSLRHATYLDWGERALLETIIASLDPTELAATPCGEGFKVAVDGDLGEWARVPAFPFAQDEGAWTWSFPELASVRPSAPATRGSVRLAWDAENLYLAIEVVDSDHHPPREAGAEWRSDGLTFRVVPQFHSMGWRNAGRFSVSGEVGRARVTALEGAQALAVRAAIGRGAGTTTYELAIARGSLSAQQGAWPPAPGDVRLTLSVSNRDEAGLRELLSFPPGPLTGRSLDTLAGVTFAPPEGTAAEKAQPP